MKCNDKILIAGVVAIAMLSTSPTVAGKFKYNTVNVSNGGTIKGIVTKSGKTPKDEFKTVTANKTQCGAKIAAEKYVISSKGEVKWAVAMLKGISEGKKLDTKSKTTLDNSGCRFEPHVLVAPAKGNFEVKNSDPMLHNSHFYLVKKSGAKKNVINLALPKKGQTIAKSKILRKAGLLSVECDAHDFMQGYIWSVPHPYAEVTNDKGGFTMTDVPPGTYTLRVWHEALGEKTASVTVAAGKTSNVKVVF